MPTSSKRAQVVPNTDYLSVEADCHFSPHMPEHSSYWPSAKSEPGSPHMLHQPGISGARTVTHIAHTADANTSPSPSSLISATHQSPFNLPTPDKLALTHTILRFLPRAKSCYPQERINMLSEWQRVVSERVEDNAGPKLALIPSSCPTSPTREVETQSRSWKRSRALADVDGDNSDTRQRKKRRLRLDLITSRLSRPYASPATHIISRNAVKLGVWTGRRYIGRNVFRKAAILNSMRRDRAAALTVEEIESPKAISLRAIHERENTDILAPGIQMGPVVSPGKPLPQQRTSVFGSAISPLKTNYDIFDDEDSDPDAEDGLPVSILGESDSDSDEADELFSFNYTSSEHTIDPPPKLDGSLELFCQRNRSLMGG